MADIFIYSASFDEHVRRLI